MNPKDIPKYIYSPLRLNALGLIIGFGRMTAVMQANAEIWGYFIAYPIFIIGGIFGILFDKLKGERKVINGVISYAILLVGAIWLGYVVYEDSVRLANCDNTTKDHLDPSR